MLALRAMTVRASCAAILRVHATASLWTSAVPPQASASLTAKVAGVAPEIRQLSINGSPVDVSGLSH